MELNRKTIQINPELFKISGGNTTRKKQKKTNDIRIKTNVEKPKKMSTIKRNILKMIRNHHQERRRSNNNDDGINVEEPLHKISSSVTDKFQNEFDESLEYLSKLTKEVDDKKQSYTIKRYPSSSSSSSSSSSISRLP